MADTLVLDPGSTQTSSAPRPSQASILLQHTTVCSILLKWAGDFYSPVPIPLFVLVRLFVVIPIVVITFMSMLARHYVMGLQVGLLSLHRTELFGLHRRSCPSPPPRTICCFCCDPLLPLQPPKKIELVAIQERSTLPPTRVAAAAARFACDCEHHQ